MFTVEFCTGVQSAEGHKQASHEQIRAWVQKQPRETVCGNHSLTAAKALKAQYPKTKTFQEIIVDIWIVDSELEEDNESVAKWANWDNIKSSLQKITASVERILTAHQALQARCFWTSATLDQFGDVVKPYGYYSKLKADWMENWGVTATTVDDFLQIAKTYGEEWNMLLQIMTNPPRKKSKSNSKVTEAACFFFIGSKGIPRAERMALWTRYQQGQIDTKQLKACYIEIKQTRALKEACLKIANSFNFMQKDNWTVWAQLSAECSFLTDRFIAINRSSFKTTRGKKSDNNDDDKVIAPPGFKDEVIRLFQRQMHLNSNARASSVALVGVCLLYFSTFIAYSTFLFCSSILINVN